jgi:ABC-type multidrug transport system permease subunit
VSSIKEGQLYQLTLTRIREFFREPEAMFWTFFFPIIMAIALGIAFRSKGPAPVYVGVVRSTDADSIAKVLNAAKINATVMTDADAHEALRKGKVGLVVVHDADGLTYRLDPARPESRVARLTTDDALQAAAGRKDPRAVKDETISEKGSRYIDFLIPGLIGLNLLSSGLWGVGYTIVNMRKEKLLKRLMSTPVKRSNFLMSFILARLVFLPVELGFVIGFANLAFGVPVRGSLLLLLAVAALGACTFTGLGVLLASRSSSTESVQGYMNLVAVPMWILSGVFFSSDHFPNVIQPVIKALPLTALNDAMRGIMLDGSTIAAITPALAVLTVWGVLSFAITLRIFRWR